MKRSILKEHLTIKDNKNKRRSTVKQKIPSGYVKSLKLDNNGIYIYRFMFNGELFTGSTGQTRLFEAERELTRVRASIQQSALGIKKKKAPTFKEAVAIWEKNKAKICTKDYVFNVARGMENHFMPKIGHKFIDCITKEDYQECLNDFIDKDPKRKLTRNYGGYNFLVLGLRSVLKEMKECKYGVAADVPNRKKSQERTKPAITKAQLEKFFTLIEAKFGTERTVGVALGIYLGLRISEICNAKWESINWSTNKFNNITSSTDTTKGNEAGNIPIPLDLIRWLNKINPDRNKLGFIVPDKKGRKPRRFLKHILAWASNQIGLARMTAHSLRRSYITILHNQGIPIKTISKLARHADVATTLRYIQVDEDAKERAIEKAFNV